MRDTAGGGGERTREPGFRARRLRTPRRAAAVALAAVAGALAACAPAPARAADPSARGLRTREAIVEAVRGAKPGDRIEIAPGTYEGGLHFTGLAGTAAKPVVLAAADPEDPPVFRGTGGGLQLTDPSHVEIVGLAFEGQTGNGLNIDDGGTPATPAHHVVLRGLVVRDVGPNGNCDGIKLSGLTDFRVEDCVVERWGRAGSAVDMVGCRRGVIERCRFTHTEGAATGSGVQTKGATSEIVIRRNRFEHAASRAVNAGGSTGLGFFRPPLAEWKGPKWEAKDIRVEGNTFVGSDAPVAFVGADGVVFRFNTVWHPRRWVLRMLQETRAEGFVPSRGVVFADNLVAFRSNAWSEGGSNVGDGTAPETSVFERNFWWCSDAPSRTRELVRTPVQEKDGVYGKDPQFADPAKGDLTLRRGSPAAKAGAGALKD